MQLEELSACSASPWEQGFREDVSFRSAPPVKRHPRHDLPLVLGILDRLVRAVVNRGATGPCGFCGGARPNPPLITMRNPDGVFHRPGCAWAEAFEVAGRPVAEPTLWSVAEILSLPTLCQRRCGRLVSTPGLCETCKYILAGRDATR